MATGRDAVRGRFPLLLASLVALILVSPFLGEPDVRAHAGVRELALGLLFMTMLMTAAYAASRSRVTVIAAWCLVAPVLLLWLVDLATGPDWVAIPRNAMGIVFVGFVVILIFRFLFSTVRVTTDTIAASLCIYFLLAVLWAEVYSIMEILEPGSFHVVGSEAQDAPLGLGAGGTAMALYYSLVTMTTLGYGDVVPRSAPARSFAAMEAVTGQMYLAVLVARLVGMHIAHSTGRLPRAPDEEPSG